MNIRNFIYFTNEQIDQANKVRISSILEQSGERYEKSGKEWRWKKHKSVTFYENNWYRHSTEEGGQAIDFMQKFFNMDFPQAVSHLLVGELALMEEWKIPSEKIKPKEFLMPEKNETMKRVYAYLINQRFIDKNIVSFFTKQGVLYESKKYHNAVFLGLDKSGVPRHAHIKSVCSGNSHFRLNQEGSDKEYGFGYFGKSTQLYVFEAAIDFLSFITLYQKDWKLNSYIVLNGVGEHAMLRALKDHSNLDTVILCLDHDEAGIENCGRLADILRLKKCKKIKRLQSCHKDWNEDLKARNGVKAIPAEKHSKIEELSQWGNILKEVCEALDEKYTQSVWFLKYLKKLESELQSSRYRSFDDIDGLGMQVTGIAIRFAEKYQAEKVEGKNYEEIINEMCRGYFPHRDKGGSKSRRKNLKQVVKEVLELLTRIEKEDSIFMDNAVKKSMELAAECVKFHLFVSVDLKDAELKKEVEMKCSQS